MFYLFLFVRSWSKKEKIYENIFIYIPVYPIKVEIRTQLKCIKKKKLRDIKPKL